MAGVDHLSVTVSNFNEMFLGIPSWVRNEMAPWNYILIEIQMKELDYQIEIIIINSNKNELKYYYDYDY